MIDLHSHILFGIDDGAKNLEMSIEMAKAWVADGVSVVACTPHIMPGLYHNTGPQIRAAAAALQEVFDCEEIPLRLVAGADNHIVPDFVGGLKSGHLLTLADTRFVLVEPPHHVAPQRMDQFFFNIQAAGFVPILTHPERLSWIKHHYNVIRQLAQNGVWMQITSASLTGSFGKIALYWANKLIDDGAVHLIATDAHDPVNRPPRLSEGFEAAARRVGDAEAANLVLHRPRGILENASPSTMPPPPGLAECSGVTNADAARTGLQLGPHTQGLDGRACGSIAGRLWRIFK